MKHRNSLRILYILLLMLIVRSVSFAQVEEAVGGFSFINCCSLPGTVSLKVNGSAYRTKGYKSGDYSSGGQLPEGSHLLLVECEGAKPITLTAAIRKGVSSIFAAYVVTEIGEDQKPVKSLKLIEIPDQPRGPGFSYNAIYIAEKPSATLYVNTKPTLLTAFKMTKLDVRGRLRVSSKLPDPNEPRNWQSPESLTFAPDEPGAYLLFAFDDLEGKISFRLVPNMLDRF